MCGIAGYVGTGNKKILEEMGRTLTHRGPDDGGVWQKGPAGLASRRLAVIDLSAAGHQPMESSDGLTAISFNGEIFNYRELRETLIARGRRFKSDCDIEVILALYEEEGTHCFEKLVGQFAIAIYDVRTETLVLARDRMGEKPLYYAQMPEGIVFGSELKALRAHPGLSFALEPRSLSHYLAHKYVPAPYTIYANVQKLLPGHFFVYREERGVLERYWTPGEPEAPISETAAKERLDTLLKGAVERQLVSDAPLGVFLSGGIDSSTIAYYAHAKVGSSLNTFAIGFEDKSFDESNDARLVARTLGTTHHEEIFSANAALALMEEIPHVFDEPVADASVLPTMLLSRFARSKVTVALGGDGADELLLGYPTFTAEKYARVWGMLPRPLRALGALLVHALPSSQGYMSLEQKGSAFVDGFAPDPFVRHLQWLGAFGEEELGRVLTPSFRASADGVVAELAKEVRSERPDLRGANALSHLYMRTYLDGQVLAKVDRASMHYSLETRAPFLDPALVSFLLSLPSEYKYRQGRGKWLLRFLMRGRLPDQILDKPKHGFAPPVGAWLKGSLAPLAREMFSAERLSRQGIFEPLAVGNLLREHQEGRRDHRNKLWTLLVFQLWAERWIR